MSAAKDQDLPTWKAVTFGSAGFLAAGILGTSIAVRLVTGVWGGTANDPLWVGPVAGATGLVFGIASIFGYFAVKDFAHASPWAIRAACSHTAAVPVESAVTGEILAAICTRCDAQLPVELFSKSIPEAVPRHLPSIADISAPTRQEILEEERESWRR